MIAQFELELEPKPRGIPQIEISFEVDASGILDVSAVDRESGKRESIQVKKLKSRLSPQDIEEMVVAAESYQF